MKITKWLTHSNDYMKDACGHCYEWIRVLLGKTHHSLVCGCVGFFPCVFPCLSLSCCNSLQVQLIRRTGLVGDEQDRCST